MRLAGPGRYGRRCPSASVSTVTISLHRPHPENELKAHQIELVLATLTQEGLK